MSVAREGDRAALDEATGATSFVRPDARRGSEGKRERGNKRASERKRERGSEWGALARGILKRATIGVPYLWLAAFFLVPFIIVLKVSFSEVAIAIPPYTPAFEWADGPAGWWEDLRALTVGNYQWIASDDLYWRSYASSVRIAFASTVLALLIGYPMAYAMARAPKAWRPTLVMLVILPFWTSFLIRVYAWIGILKREGLLNQFLQWLGVIDDPLVILNTSTAVYIGVVYSYLPFMVLPLYAALERMDESLLEAAADLGARPWTAFWTVTVPLSIPGVIAGSMLVFIPAVGEFVIPDLLGGSGTLMIGKTLWVEFFNNRDWPVSSAVAVILLLILVVPITIFQQVQARGQAAERGQ